METETTSATQEDEEPLCAVCESSEAEPLIVRKGHQVVKCGQCGLVYMSPRPRRRQELHDLYTDDAYCRRQILHAGHAGRTNEAQWRLAQLERHVTRRGRLLDVGCSTASFLVAARDKGWDVTGLDVSAGAIEYATSVLGLSAVVGTLEEARLPPASFDVITVFECIEHMPDPAGALAAASRLLKPDGVLVITTPNIDGLVPRVTYHLLARTIGPGSIPRHRTTSTSSLAARSRRYFTRLGSARWRLVRGRWDFASPSSRCRARSSRPQAPLRRRRSRACPPTHG